MLSFNNYYQYRVNTQRPNASNPPTKLDRELAVEEKPKLTLQCLCQNLTSNLTKISFIIPWTFLNKIQFLSKVFDHGKFVVNLKYDFKYLVIYEIFKI